MISRCSKSVAVPATSAVAILLWSLLEISQKKSHKLSLFDFLHVLMNSSLFLHSTQTFQKISGAHSYLEVWN